MRFEARLLTGCSMTRRTLRLMSAMASVWHTNGSTGKEKERRLSFCVVVLLGESCGARSLKSKLYDYGENMTGGKEMLQEVPSEQCINRRSSKVALTERLQEVPREAIFFS